MSIFIVFFSSPPSPPAPHPPFPRGLWHEGSAPAGRGSAAWPGHGGWRGRAARHGLARPGWPGPVGPARPGTSWARRVSAACPMELPRTPLPRRPAPPRRYPHRGGGGEGGRAKASGGREGAIGPRASSPRGRQAPAPALWRGVPGRPGGACPPGHRGAGHRSSPAPACVQPSSVTGLLLKKLDLSQ